MEIHPAQIVAVVLGLVAAITALWHTVQKYADRESAATARARERAEQCEKSHKEISLEVKSLFGEVNRLKGEMKGVQDFSASVLTALQNAVNRRRLDDSDARGMAKRKLDESC